MSRAAAPRRHRGAPVLGLLVVAACGGGLAPIGPAGSPAPDTDATSTVAAAPATTRPSVTWAVDSSAGRLDAPERTARIALDRGAGPLDVSATGAFGVWEQAGRVRLVRGDGEETWRIEQKGDALRVSDGRGDATPWRRGPFVLRAETTASLVRFRGRRYRGEIWFVATDTGTAVVNHVGVEEYLRGVVPLELGTRDPQDLSALEAQTVAARSYTLIRVPATDRRPPEGYHMTDGVMHQVYRGAEAEHPVVDAAVAATRGLVLRWNGRVVDAPYSASCGGRTADPTDVWDTKGESPWLHSVDDVDPKTGRPWCDISPRNAWEVTLDESLLREAVRRHLVSRGAREAQAPRIRTVRVTERSAAGRVRRVALETDRGDVALAGNDIRFAFRDARGAILSSTYFQVGRETHAGGRLATVELRGAGNGHGVGLCQWGAIGRARAGYNARAILGAYYPGTTVGFAD